MREKMCTEHTAQLLFEKLEVIHHGRVHHPIYIFTLRSEHRAHTRHPAQSEAAFPLFLVGARTRHATCRARVAPWPPPRALVVVVYACLPIHCIAALWRRPQRSDHPVDLFRFLPGCHATWPCHVSCHHPPAIAAIPTSASASARALLATHCSLRAIVRRAASHSAPASPHSASPHWALARADVPRARHRPALESRLPRGATRPHRRRHSTRHRPPPPRPRALRPHRGRRTHRALQSS